MNFFINNNCKLCLSVPILIYVLKFNQIKRVILIDSHSFIYEQIIKV